MTRRPICAKLKSGWFPQEEVIRNHAIIILGGYEMGCLGNTLWFVFGGCISGLSWCLAGCLWCITILGIPIGLQCFKFASLCFFPFGKEVRYGGGAGSFLLNLLWLIFSVWAPAFQTGKTGTDAVWIGSNLGRFPWRFFRFCVRIWLRIVSSFNPRSNPDPPDRGAV